MTLSVGFAVMCGAQNTFLWSALLKDALILLVHLSKKKKRISKAGGSSTQSSMFLLSPRVFCPTEFLQRKPGSQVNRCLPGRTEILLSKYVEHWPAELLDSADINDPVVEMVHKLWHVLFQEPLVCMHRVTCRKRNKRNLRDKSAHQHYQLTSAAAHQQGDTVRGECAVWQTTGTHTRLVPGWFCCFVQPGSVRTTAHNIGYNI